MVSVSGYRQDPSHAEPVKSDAYNGAIQGSIALLSWKRFPSQATRLPAALRGESRFFLAPSLDLSVKSPFWRFMLTVRLPFVTSLRQCCTRIQYP